uniref:hypothetical protein n=1 Tax=Cupriavidus metallidurans TaxID=119219 RepID=UPI003158A448
MLAWTHIDRRCAVVQANFSICRGGEGVIEASAETTNSGAVCWFLGGSRQDSLLDKKDYQEAKKWVVNLESLPKSDLLNTFKRVPDARREEITSAHAGGKAVKCEPSR